MSKPDPSNLLSLEGGTIACDTETTGLSVWHGARPFAFSFCNEKGDTRYLRVDVDPISRAPKIPWKVSSQLKDFFSQRRRFVFWNAKFDVRMLEAIGVPVGGEIHDAMHGMHVLNSDEPTFQLKPMAKKYADYPDDDQKDLHRAVMRARRVAKAKGWSIAESPYADYWLAPPEICGKYAVGDAERTMLLWLIAEQEMPKANVVRVYDDERALWPIVYEMETRGVRLNKKLNDQEIDRWRKYEVEALARCHAIAGRKFDPQKPGELRQVLFKRLGIPVDKVTEKTGAPATDAKVLRVLKHPIARAILEYRAARKVVSTFFLRYDATAVQDQATGLWIMHPEFNQLGPRTGRFSSRNPNMQNVSDDAGANPAVPISARTTIGPRPGYWWYSIDYSQMETRIFASMAGEVTMLEAFRKGDDLHALTAKLCWPDEWAAAQAMPEGEARDFERKHLRNRAKFFNFGIIYGIGPKSAAAQLDVPEATAKGFLDSYRNKFPFIDKYMKQVASKSKLTGEIRTAYGRRVPVDIERAYASVNYLIQGTAADMTKRAMRQSHAYIRSTGADAHLMLTIHDEIIFEWNQRHAYKHLLLGTMRAMEDHGGALQIDLPTEVSQIATAWAHKKKLKLKESA